MALRTRVLLSSGLIVVIGALLAALVGSWVVLQGFAELEQVSVERDLGRAGAALQADLSTLAGMAGAWSARDDLHGFVLGERAEADHPRRDLPTETLLGLGVDAVVVTDRATAVRHVAAVDPAAGAADDPSALLARLRGNGLLRPFGVLDDERTGLLRVGDRLLALSVHPITDSRRRAAPSGTFTLARWMDEDRAGELAERTRLDLALDAAAPEIMGVETRTAPTTITAARTLRGIAGEPVVELSVTQPRAVLAQGRTSVRWLTLVVVGVLVLAGLMLLGIADRQVLRRLRRLGREIQDVGHDAELTTRVVEDGVGDEIHGLAVALNDSLGALARTRHDLQVRNAELERANSELARANTELDAANRERRRFLSAVSHDLRNPLTSIDGFATLLRSRWEQLPDDQRQHFLHRIETNAGAMEAMVDDLLTLSRLEEGVVVAVPERVDLARCLPTIVAELSGSAVEVLGARGAVEVDPAHLRRILGNLLDNADKYGAPPVEVEAVVDEDTVEVRVRDHGPGVEAAFEEVLFEAFTQAREGRGVDTGVGLGLSIVQHLTLQNGGTVAHDRDVTPGACFVVRLPRITAPAPMVGA